MGNRKTTDPMLPADTSGPASQSLQLFSHDIRAAMSDVIGGLRLIDRARLTREAQLQIDRVQAAADTLAGLVDDALMAAAGEPMLDPGDGAVCLSDWLAALSGRWAGRASEAGGRFEIVTPAELPAMLRLSQVTIDRIVGNLVSNALLHAPGRTVTLTLAGDRGEGLTLTVTDTGQGYPDKVLERIGRGDAAMPMGRHAGSGLGLRIAADLTGEIGGRLSFANRPEGGASARFWLPEALIDRDIPSATAAPLPDLQGLRILVAEDNLTNQAILRGLLGGMGAQAVFVADGAAALQMGCADGVCPARQPRGDL